MTDLDAMEARAKAAMERKATAGPWELFSDPAATAPPHRPPLGIKPRRFWLEERLEDLMRASLRHRDACAAIPDHYVEEMLKIMLELREAAP